MTRPRYLCKNQFELREISFHRPSFIIPLSDNDVSDWGQIDMRFNLAELVGHQYWSYYTIWNIVDNRIPRLYLRISEKQTATEIKLVSV